MATATINRSAQHLRTIFPKNGGRVATPGNIFYLLRDDPSTVNVFTPFEVIDAILDVPAF